MTEWETMPHTYGGLSSRAYSALVQDCEGKSKQVFLKKNWCCMAFDVCSNTLLVRIKALPTCMDSSQQIYLKSFVCTRDILPKTIENNTYNCNFTTLCEANALIYVILQQAIRLPPLVTPEAN